MHSSTQAFKLPCSLVSKTLACRHVLAANTRIAAHTETFLSRVLAKKRMKKKGRIREKKDEELQEKLRRERSNKKREKRRG